MVLYDLLLFSSLIIQNAFDLKEAKIYQNFVVAVLERFILSLGSVAFSLILVSSLANKKHRGSRPETGQNEIVSLYSVSLKVKSNATASCGANSSVITR